MTRLPTPLLVLVFAGSLGLALGASTVFARRLDRLGTRLGWPEALVGLLTATAADGPELTSAIIAIAQGSGAVGAGVVVGSNLFNLAAMVGAVALVTPVPIRIGRRDLIEEVGVALAVTGSATLVLAGLLPAWIGLAACGFAAFLYVEALDLPRRPAAPTAAVAAPGRRGVEPAASAATKRQNRPGRAETSRRGRSAIRIVPARTERARVCPRGRDRFDAGAEIKRTGADADRRE